MARRGHRPPRQPRAGEPLRREGGRPPGVERLDGQPHVRALVLGAARRGPRVGQAARLAGAARDQLPAGPPRAPLPRDAARVRGPAELSQPHQGPRPGGLLDRLGGHRRHRPDLERVRAPLPRAPSLRGAADGPPDRPRGRRRARRGRDLGGGGRPRRGQARRGAVGGGPQPPVARPRGARHRLRALGQHVRGRGLAGDQRQVRRAAGRAVRAARRARAAPAHRRDAQRGVPAPAALHPGGAARAPARRRRRAPAARDGAERRRAASRAARPGRARPRQADRGLPRRGQRSPDGGVRLHDQGLVAAGGGPPREPLRAAHARADARAGRRTGRRRRRPLGRVRPRQPGGRAVRRRGRHPHPRGACAARAAGGAGHARAQAPRRGVDPAGVRALLRRPRPRGARGGGARGHAQPRRGQLHQPGRLDQQGRDLVGGRKARLVRRRSADARALARDARGPPHRAGHRRDQPRGPAGRAGRHLEPLRPAAAADRHHLRPVRGARAGAVVVRHVRRRPVDPGGHAERRVAGARGRRAPVDRHAVDRHRPARLHGVGARLRARPGVDAPARAVAARAPGRRVRLPAPVHSADRPGAGGRSRARARAGRRLPAAPRRPGTRA